jgi:hypothetical protein
VCGNVIPLRKNVVNVGQRQVEFYVGNVPWNTIIKKTKLILKIIMIKQTLLEKHIDTKSKSNRTKMQIKFILFFFNLLNMGSKVNPNQAVFKNET